MLKQKITFKYFLGIMVVFIALVYIRQPSLPSCDSKETHNAMRKMFMEKFGFKELNSIVELSSDKINGKLCRGNIITSKFGDTAVQYKISWKDSSYNPFLQRERAYVIEVLDQ